MCRGFVRFVIPFILIHCHIISFSHLFPYCSDVLAYVDQMQNLISRPFAVYIIFCSESDFKPSGACHFRMQREDLNNGSLFFTTWLRAPGFSWQEWAQFFSCDQCSNDATLRKASPISLPRIKRCSKELSTTFDRIIFGGIVTATWFRRSFQDDETRRCGVYGCQMRGGAQYNVETTHCPHRELDITNKQVLITVVKIMFAMLWTLKKLKN